MFPKTETTYTIYTHSIYSYTQVCKSLVGDRGKKDLYKTGDCLIQVTVWDGFIITVTMLLKNI